MPEALYKLLNDKEIPNVRWNCDGCIRVSPSLEGIQEFLKDYKADKKEMNNRMDSFDDKIAKIQEKIDTEIEDKIQKQLKSFKEREDKKCNLVIHNLQESDNISKEKAGVRQNTSRMFTRYCGGQ